MMVNKGLLLGVSVSAMILSLGLGNIASVQAASLVDAVHKAVTTNPDLDAAKANRRAQEYELKQSRGLYLPSLDVTNYVGPGRSKMETDLESSSWATRSSASATLTQLLFDGFSRESDIEIRAARVDGAAFRVRERGEVISLNATEAYLNVLRNQELVELARWNIRNHEVTLGKVQTRESGGQSGIGDVQQALARLAVARDTLAQAEQSLKEVQINFRRIVGEDPKNLTRPRLAANVLPGNVEVAVQESLGQSPTLYANAASIDEAIATHRQAAAPFYPTFNIVATALYDNNVATDGWRRDVSVLLRMDWNLYRGNIDMNRRMETAERIGESRATQASTERAVEEETRLSWTAMEIAHERIKLLDNEVAANAQVVSIYTQEFEIGQRELLNVLDAQNDLFNSKSKAVTASYVAQFSGYRVLASLGRLASYFNAPTPVEADARARVEAGVTPDWKPASIQVK